MLKKPGNVFWGAKGPLWLFVSLNKQYSITNILWKGRGHIESFPIVAEQIQWIALLGQKAKSVLINTFGIYIMHKQQTNHV